MNDWDKPPFIIIQKEFWKCPTHVFTGIHFALIGFLVGVLFAVWALPANAGDGRNILCMLRADNARMIMQFRQDGMDEYRLLRILNKNPGLDRYELAAFRDSIEQAYATPRMRNAHDRRRIVTDFTRDTERLCMQRNPVNR